MKMQVTYDNGEEATYKVKPRHLIAYEDEFGEFSETARGAFALAHFASDTPLSFKDWLANVDDIRGIPEAGDEEKAKGDDTEAEAEGEEEAAAPVPTE